MLEQLQRLQAHIGVLKTRLHHLESENSTLLEAKELAETEHHAQVVQKKSTTDLKNRFQEILAERNELRVTKEKLQSHQRQTQQELHDLQQDRDRLLQKNELAKAKVEAIIQRLAILGTAQDQHAQEIQQLAHPNAEAGEETQS